MHGVLVEIPIEIHHQEWNRLAVMKREKSLKEVTQPVLVRRAQLRKKHSERDLAENTHAVMWETYGFENGIWCFLRNQACRLWEFLQRLPS